MAPETTSHAGHESPLDLELDRTDGDPDRGTEVAAAANVHGHRYRSFPSRATPSPGMFSMIQRIGSTPKGRGRSKASKGRSSGNS